MDDYFQPPVVVAEVMLLGLILALVDHTLLRVSLGLIVAILLARTALARHEGIPAGEPGDLYERRRDHLFRHSVDSLLKKLREFHAVCQSVSAGNVKVAAGELRIDQIEGEIQALVGRVTDTARPDATKKARGEAQEDGRRSEVHGGVVGESGGGGR